MSAPTSTLDQIRDAIGAHLDDLESDGDDPVLRAYSLWALRNVCARLDSLGARDLLRSQPIEAMA